MQTQIPPRPKSPVIAALLNFLVPGLGYSYVGSKRNNLRKGLMIATALALFSPVMQGPTKLDPAFLVSGLIMVVVFAVDAWEDAKETQRIVIAQKVAVKDDEA